MIYPIVIHKDRSSDYGVTVPDLPGCFSAGRTQDEAIAMASEAIALHLEGLIEEGAAVPRPRTVDEHQGNAAFKGGVWALVKVDPAHLRLHAKRVNITMTERVLAAVDRAARVEDETRSSLLTKAASAYLEARTRAARPQRKSKWRAK